MMVIFEKYFLNSLMSYHYSTINPNEEKTTFRSFERFEQSKENCVDAFAIRRPSLKT